MQRGGLVVEPAGQAGQPGGVHHPDGDRVPVPEPVALHALDGVAEGVPVVQDLARALLGEVGRHHPGLDPDGALDQLAGVRGRAARWRPRGRLDQVQDGRVGDEAGLDHLGQARSRSRPGAASRAWPGRRARRRASGTRRPGSCPRGCRSRSSRPPPRRPCPAAWSGPGPPGRRAARWRPRTRPGRWSLPRRGRRCSRSGSPCARPASTTAGRRRRRSWPPRRPAPARRRRSSPAALSAPQAGRAISPRPSAWMTTTVLDSFGTRAGSSPSTPTPTTTW